MRTGESSTSRVPGTESSRYRTQKIKKVRKRGRVITDRPDFQPDKEYSSSVFITILDKGVLFNQEREKICDFYYMLEPVGLRGRSTNTLGYKIFTALVGLRLGSYVQMGRYLYEMV